MLGPYPGVPQMKRTTVRNRELAEYIQWEYGPGTSVESYLAQVASGSRKTRSNRRRRIANGLRAFAKALTSALGRTSRTPEPEV